MKKALLLGYLLILSMASPLLAQQPADRGADLEAIRIGYITKKLSLTPDEAKQFWPVYDAYRAEMREVRGEMRETAQTAREDFDVMTDQEVEAAVNKMLDNRRKELDITLKYHEQFKKVLNIRKVAKLYKAEREFTQMIIARLQERQASGTAPGPGGRPGGRFQR
jgi:Spy/CpxP family protein refolding chaperone